MANEATVSCGMRIKIGNTDWRAYPTQFKADVSEESGPSPGDIIVDRNGRNIDLSEIGVPGLCWIQNRSDTYYILVGIQVPLSPSGVDFFPLLELLPGEAFPLRLYRFLGTEFTGTGTGTPSDVNQLHIKSIGGTSRVFVGACGK